APMPPKEAASHPSLLRIALDQTGVEHRAALASPLTYAGAIVGTPAYMAPEQLAGGEVGPRADQFSFCVALYEALHGTRPCEGTSIPAIASAISRGDVKPSTSSVRVPRGVRRALLRGLRAEPSARFASMGELLDALEASTGSRRAWVVATAVVCAATLAAGVA